MKKSTFLLAAALFAAPGFGPASAQNLFLDSDIVRGNQPGAPGPICVLNSQFKHLEKLVFRFRVHDPDGKLLDDKGVKSLVVEFPDVPTKPPTYQIAASPYLHELGIGIRDVRPAESTIVLVNNLGLYGGQGVHPTTSQNLLTQVGTGNVPASFTLQFKQPATSVSFVRPRLYPETESGITHAFAVSHSHATPTTPLQIDSPHDRPAADR